MPFVATSRGRGWPLPDLVQAPSILVGSVWKPLGALDLVWLLPGEHAPTAGNECTGGGTCHNMGGPSNLLSRRTAMNAGGWGGGGRSVVGSTAPEHRHAHPQPAEAGYPALVAGDAESASHDF